MNKLLQIARVPGGGAPSIINVPYTASATLKRGSIVTITSGLVADGIAAGSPIPASQTNLYGVALQDSDSNPGYAAANSPATITGRSATIAVAKANAQTIFEALFYSTATLTAPADTDRGVNYGLRKQAGGFWTVDKALTGTSAYVTIVDIDIDLGIVFFKFIQSSVVI